MSMAKYSRLPKKKENERVKMEVVKEVATARRKQHLSSLQYYCALNALQYRKRAAMMEPLIGFAHGQVGEPLPMRGSPKAAIRRNGSLIMVTGAQSPGKVPRAQLLPELPAGLHL